MTYISADSPFGAYWIAASIIATAVYFVLASAYVRKNSPISIHFTMAVTHGLASIFLFCVSAAPPQASSGLYTNLLVVALLMWLAKSLYFYAYSRTTVANVTLFSAFTPLYAALIGPLMGYPLSTMQIVGIGVITGSVLLFFAKERGAAHAPLYRMAMLCAFLSTIPSAISGYFQKDAVLQSDPLYVSFFICVFTAIASFTYLFARQGKTVLTQLFKLPSPHYLLAIGALQALAAVGFSVFIAQEHPATGQALQRLSSLLQIILAHLFLAQRYNTLLYLLCVGLSIIGIYILSIG